MRLLRVEFTRFRCRRAVALMLLGAALLVAWMTIDTAWSTRPVGEAEVAAAKQQAAQDLQFQEEDYQRCLDDPAGYVGDDTATPEQCPVPQSDYRWYLDRAPLDLEEELVDTGKAAVVVLAGLAIIVGATFAGADWATGSMSNQLIFRPRRAQVWAAKGVAVAVGVAVAGVVVIAAQWAFYFAVAEMRDIAAPDGFTADLLQTSGRGIALIAAGGLGGYALTMLLRSTVGTLALLFFYSVGGETLVAVLPFDRMSQWSLANNLFAWLDDGVLVYDENIGGEYALSLAHGAAYLGTLLVLVVLVSAAVFQRRDVP